MVCSLMSAEYRQAHTDYADSGINFGTCVTRRRGGSRGPRQRAHARRGGRRVRPHQWQDPRWLQDDGAVLHGVQHPLVVPAHHVRDDAGRRHARAGQYVRPLRLRGGGGRGACPQPPTRACARSARLSPLPRPAAAWNEDDVIRLFTKDATTAAVAYPLRASNRGHLWAQFQDLEYLTAGYMKLAQVCDARAAPRACVRACVRADRAGRCAWVRARCTGRRTAARRCLRRARSTRGAWT